MDKETVRWEAEKNMYSGIVTGIVGREMHVLEAEDGELGYTKAGVNVRKIRSRRLSARSRWDMGSSWMYS